MFAAHIGAAMAIGRAERRVNVGVFIVAALLPDIVLWLFVLLGWEFVIIPADFASTHQPEFVFPYSHGLLASLAWSALAGAFALMWYSGLKSGKWRAAMLIAAAVVSHWVLDVLVHAPELPLASDDSLKLGLALWQNMPAALLVEAIVVVAGLRLFMPGAKLPRAARLWLGMLAVVILALTVAGMTVAPPPPSAAAMAASSLATIIALCALAIWLGRKSPA